MNLRNRFKLFIAVLFITFLALGSPLLAYGAEKDTLHEVRAILRDSYVDVVPEEVLQAPTIQEMLGKLGDRHTQYMTGAEYNQFTSTLDRAFSGVGIELEMAVQGVKVTKVIEGYGAYKAGILQGDMIIEAGGNSLAGKTYEYCISKLRGANGSKVLVKVQRGTETLSFTLERMVIELPLVEGEVMENHIGYIAIYSFGTDTVIQFDKQARALKEKGVDSWIIDLRDNGGGYTQAAFDLLGYFIGEKTAVILKDRSPVSVFYKATKQDYILNGPIVLLINGYTGSSSEITTAALKDHNKATIIGERTYGSGRVKALIPLSNGDYLKMTVNRFFSPNNHPIDEVGVAPHLDLSGVDELQAAVLMLKNWNEDVAKNGAGDKSGYIQFNGGSNDFVLSLEDLRKAENWSLGKKIFDSAYVTTTLKLGGQKGWDALPEEYVKEPYKIYYPDYVLAGNLSAIPLNKTFKVTFTNDMDWNSVTPESIELIDTASGQRIKCDIAFPGNQVMTVTPQTLLQADTDYWLVIHSTLKDGSGRNIAGGVALAKSMK